MRNETQHEQAFVGFHCRTATQKQATTQPTFLGVSVYYWTDTAKMVG
ncbi:MAG: hypothetical protein QNJ68_08440 [Microcoleaceae cyanobacterium MO_207.B10]|nr:hypothetical protein [Microcoleaceae cyanobacterium MO_207.B10]